MLALQVCSAQERPREVRFALALGDAPLRLGEEVGGWDLDTVAVDVLKFYVSNMALLRDGKAVWTDVSGPHLIDASDSSSLALPLAVPAGVKADALRFTLGIDSATNVSGALGGDLDPTKGMYWTWQSGYVNVKIEGRSDWTPNKDRRFQYHLGGYLPPFGCAKEVVLPTGDGGTIVIDVNLWYFFKGVDKQRQHKVMSPSADAVYLSMLAAGMFQSNGGE